MNQIITKSAHFYADTIALASQSLLLQAVILSAVIACTTRFISGKKCIADSSGYRDASNVATLPYWIPYLGHVIPMVLNATRFLRRCSQQAAKESFALYLFGSKYIIVWTPQLIASIFEQPNAALSSHEISWSISSRVFGASKKHKQNDLRVHNIARGSLYKELSSDPKGLGLGHSIIRGIQQNAPELVSFSTSIVDENAWERTASPTIQESHVEISLFALLKNFVAHVSLPSLVGTEFLEAYPSTSEDLWDLDGGFKWLMLGVNRLLGIPSLTRAHIARRRLLHAIHTFHRAIDRVQAGDEPDEPFRHRGDSGSLLEKIRSVWRSSSLRDVSGLYDLSLLWSVSTKSGYLVFWILIRVWATPGLAKQVRDEISTYARATQPPRVFGIPEAPRLEIDMDGLLKSCPLLKACFYECVRLYSTPTSVRMVNKDIVVRGDDGDGAGAWKYSLEAGTTVAAPFNLHHHDIRYFKDPSIFLPARFLKSSEEGHGEQNFVNGAIKPWGVGESACPGREFAEKQVLAFVAGILALWDFEPADVKGWIIPDQVERAVISVPAVDTRVRLRPRELVC